MPTTARGLAELLVSASTNGLRAGALMHQADKAKPGSRARPILKRIAEDALAAHRAAKPAAPRHPEQVARRSDRRGQGPLKPADLAWLARIADIKASELPYDDAVSLAEIRASLRPEDASDRRYVDSIWKPIDDYHARRTAQAQREAVRGMRVAVPDGVIDLIAESLTVELTGDFTADEIYSRARALVSDTVAAENNKIRAQQDAAQQAIDRLDAEKATRAQVDR